MNRTVIFLADKPYFSIARHALNLKKQGIQTKLIYCSEVSIDVKRFLKDVFGQIIFEEKKELIMEKANRISTELHFFQTWMWKYKETYSMLSASKAEKKIVEFYDITSFFAETDDLKKIWKSEDVDSDMFYEKELIKSSTTSFARFPQSILDEYASKFNCAGKLLELHPCSSEVSKKSFFSKMTNLGKKFTILYTGGLIPRNEAHPAEIFPERGLFDVFEELIKKGFQVEVLHDPNRPLRNEKESLKDFFKLSKRNKNFKLFDGIPPDLYSKKAANYFAGIILSNIPIQNRIGKNILRGGVGTKFFSYLEAGLPIMVNNEYIYMKKLIEKYNAGLAFSFSDLILAKKGEIVEKISKSKTNISYLLKDFYLDYNLKLSNLIK